jgi:hypothetical protein
MRNCCFRMFVDHKDRQYRNTELSMFSLVELTLLEEVYQHLHRFHV